MRKLKILEVAAFSAGICGVWTRVLAESKLLAKTHKVYVFSSDIFRGEDGKKAEPSEVIDKVEVRRFPAKFSFGQNTYFWNFEKQALAISPDIIVVHAYRQYYSTLALRVAKKLNIPCFLVTHAPFLEKKLRNWKLNLAVSLYDYFIGRRILNKYAKVIAITKWEMPYLAALGVKKENIEYIPNGIPEEFFKHCPKSGKNQGRLLFLGRVAPIKDIATQIKALSIVKDEKITLDIVGPAEKDYKSELELLVKNLKLEKRVKFLPAVYDLKKKIKILDSHDVFILSSKREAMPQALIEAMARGKIAISSGTDGGKEIIMDKENGFLFNIGDAEDLADKIGKALKCSNKFKNKTINSVKKFSWNKIMATIERTYTI